MSMLSRILPRVSAVSRQIQSNANQKVVLQSSKINLNLRPISYTSNMQAQITVNVPTMGDSITEGTIVEWCVPPGSRVSEGDVLALVETDKVTIDIKAEQEGVLVKQLGDVEAVIEVGEGLYVLDTDTSVATSSVESNTNEVNVSLDAEQMLANDEPAPTLSTTSSSSSTARVPSIHFLGKEGWKKLLTATDEPNQTTTTTTIPTSNSPSAPTSITQMPYSSMYGRPAITEEEMEALVLGGAEEAPEVHSVTSSDGLSGFSFVGGKVTTAGPRGVWLAE